MPLFGKSRAQKEAEAVAKEAANRQEKFMKQRGRDIRAKKQAEEAARAHGRNLVQPAAEPGLSVSGQSAVISSRPTVVAPVVSKPPTAAETAAAKELRDQRAQHKVDYTHSVAIACQGQSGYGDKEPGRMPFKLSKDGKGDIQKDPATGEPIRETCMSYCSPSYDSTTGKCRKKTRRGRGGRKSRRRRKSNKRKTKRRKTNKTRRRRKN